MSAVEAFSQGSLWQLALTTAASAASAGSWERLLLSLHAGSDHELVARSCSAIISAFQTQIAGAGVSSQGLEVF